jgi:predicted homoserine dehydrogenase-like protein
MSMWGRVAQWAAAGGEAAVAVVGAGYVGSGVVHRLERTPGMRAAVVANRTVDRAVRAYEAAGHARERVVASDDPGALADAVARGAPAVTADASVLGELDGVDVVLEATGALDHGAATMRRCLRAGRDVISYTAEADATVGWLLHRTAREHGSVYTVADGDQPGVLLRHLEFVTGMGFEPVAALNCKRNLDVHQTPDDSAGYAARDKTSLLMTTAFGDGTKMQVENAVVANATGLVPDRRGMHGVRTTRERAAGDVVAAVSRTGVVDFTLGGDFGAGVGVVGRAPEPDEVATALRFLKMGEGPDYFFFRPYHLVHFEVPMTVGEVVLDRAPLGEVVTPPVAEVVAVAKRDLEPGEALDGIGGFCCYGLIDTAEAAAGLLPVGLSGHARVTRRVPQDAAIPLDAVELDESAAIVALRREQEALLADRVALG